MQEVVEPDDLIGREVSGVVVGWHVYKGSRHPIRMVLRLGDGSNLEARLGGDGSLALVRASAPEDVDMAESGHVEFRPAIADRVLDPILGATLTAVRRIQWRGATIGLRLEVGRSVVVLVNNGDEVFWSPGSLPPDYLDATLEPAV